MPVTSTSYHFVAVRLTALLMLFYFCLLPSASYSQVTENPVAATEQQLENDAANNNDTETEDDSYQQQMLQYIKHPVNLNAAGAGELATMQLLSPIQVQNFIRYRNLLGRFISIYELQAIPAWDIALIQKIRPYITISNSVEILPVLKSRLRGGEHGLLTRISQTLERSKGYVLDTASANNFYPGSPQKILVRYQYQYKNLLQYGVVAEKDAGEQFFKGTQKQGFDFYSAHFFARKIGLIQILALGDFTVNLGQGLTQWQSLAFKKTADVLNIKRESAVLRPYSSAGEINFHRGAGITIAKKQFEASFFVSGRKIDANLVLDTTRLTASYISSLQNSGYHRTKSETDDKAAEQQLAAGGNLSYTHKTFHTGINAVYYKFALPLNKSNDPYNIYALNGSVFGNYSIDYSYTYKNMHWFGEAAVNNQLYKGYINGLLISVSSRADISLLYRNISPGYQSLYSSAFTENTYPANETGMYAGVSVHSGGPWQVDGYADFYKFPWLKSRVDAPGAGADYLLQLTYKPGKQLEIYSRLHSETKSINFNPAAITLSPVVLQPKLNWRTQFSYRLNPDITVKSRVEVVWFDAKTVQKEQGFLAYVDLSCKPKLQPWSANLRFQYFDTDSYNSRIYAYENDVLFSYSIPVFYNKGSRIYINANCNINKRFTIYAKFAQTVYDDKTVIGTGLDEISGGRKTEFKLQVICKF